MRLLFGIVLAATCCLAAASDTPEVNAAKRLFDLMGVDVMYADVDAACRKNMNRTLDARASYVVDPNAFGGMTPSSANWRELEQVFEDYGRDACGVSDIDAIKQIYVQLLSTRLSLAELESTIASQLTPAGQKTRLAMIDGARLLMTYQLAQQQKNVAKANERIEIRMRALADKYKEAPR